MKPKTLYWDEYRQRAKTIRERETDIEYIEASPPNDSTAEIKKLKLKIALMEYFVPTEKMAEIDHKLKKHVSRGEV